MLSIPPFQDNSAILGCSTVLGGRTSAIFGLEDLRQEVQRPAYPTLEDLNLVILMARSALTLIELEGKEASSSPSYILEAQAEGGYIATSRQHPGAVGEGETAEEAIKDLEEAIDLLKEELEEQG